MGMEYRWKGPAANAMCCTEVRTAWENRKMVLCELYGWATCGELMPIRVRGEMTHLLNQLSTAHDQRWACISRLVLLHRNLFKISRDDKLKLPSTLFPEIVDTRNPTSCSVGRGWRRVSMGDTLSKVEPRDRGHCS
jgi:hypothetical protein